MKLTLAAVLALTITLLSCQKEPNVDLGTTPASGGGNTNGLLVKAVAVTGSETLTSLYGYDNQKRLETITMDGSSGGMQIHNYQKYARDNTGRITQIIQQVDNNGISSDTTVNNIHYPSATSMDFDYSINIIGLSGYSVTDSSAYHYSAGKMTSIDSYLSAPLIGTSVMQNTRYDFSYDASGRVSSQKIYNSTTPSGPMVLVASETFTYGSVIEPSWYSTSASQNYLINGLPQTSTNALSSLQVVNATDPTGNITVNLTYVLGAGNKPVSSTATTTGAQPQVTKYTYFYQ
ncbi:MAG: hypothetical protein ACJ75B_05890 [Flavisolibacter sp.]